jgi:hypothetical protein
MTMTMTMTMTEQFDLLNGPDGPVDPNLVGDLLFSQAQVKRMRISTYSLERLGRATDRVRVENPIEILSLVSSFSSGYPRWT